MLFDPLKLFLILGMLVFEVISLGLAPPIVVYIHLFVSCELCLELLPCKPSFKQLLLLSLKQLQLALLLFEFVLYILNMVHDILVALGFLNLLLDDWRHDIGNQFSQFDFAHEGKYIVFDRMGLQILSNFLDESLFVEISFALLVEGWVALLVSHQYGHLLHCLLFR